MPKVKKTILLFTAFSAFLAAFVLRCVGLLGLNGSDTGELIKNGENVSAAFFVLVAVFIAFDAVFSFIQSEMKTAYKCESKAVSVFSMLCCAAMFYDFVIQCLNCYNYTSKSSYVALNKIIPMVLCGVFALLSAVYFAVIGISFSSSRYDFRQVRVFGLFPLLWALCGVFTDLTDYTGGIFDEESVLKSLMLLFAMLFFLFFAGTAEDFENAAKLKALVFSGLSYGMLCTVACVPRFIAFISRRAVEPAQYSGVAFMFSGAFAAAISFYILFTKKD